MSLKDALKHSFLARYLIRKLRARRFARQSRQQAFSEIHRQNAWGSPESLSGPGSELAQTASLRTALPTLLQRLNVRTFLDAPCGDFHWMQHVDLGATNYIGIDIVPALIAANNQQFARPAVPATSAAPATGARQFLHSDLVAPAAPLPAADLALCRDCLMHLSFDEARALLKNLCSTGAAHLLITTFPLTTRNASIGRGGWWPMNLQLAPFHLPAPLELIPENPPDPEARRLNKSVALWPAPAIQQALSR